MGDTATITFLIQHRNNKKKPRQQLLLHKCVCLCVCVFPYTGLVNAIFTLCTSKLYTYFQVQYTTIWCSIYCVYGFFVTKNET